MAISLVFQSFHLLLVLSAPVNPAMGQQQIIMDRIRCDYLRTAAASDLNVDGKWTSVVIIGEDGRMSR